MQGYNRRRRKKHPLKERLWGKKSEQKKFNEERIIEGQWEDREKREEGEDMTRQCQTLMVLSITDKNKGRGHGRGKQRDHPEGESSSLMTPGEVTWVEMREREKDRLKDKMRNSSLVQRRKEALVRREREMRTARDYERATTRETSRIKSRAERK